jgi:hypothetical protein
MIENGAMALDDATRLLAADGGVCLDGGTITDHSSAGTLVLDFCAESNYGGILIDGGVTLDLHGCPLTIGTLILADGVLDLDGGRPSPSARKAEGVRLVTRCKRGAEGNIVPARNRKRRCLDRRPSEGFDDSPGAAQ